MQEAKVVTCFLLRRLPGGDEVLLLRRSQHVGTYRGRWAAVSGYLEEADPLAQAYREMEEEAGLMREEVSLLQTGEPLVVVDAEAGRRWNRPPVPVRGGAGRPGAGRLGAYGGPLGAARRGLRLRHRPPARGSADACLPGAAAIDPPARARLQPTRPSPPLCLTCLGTPHSLSHPEGGAIISRRACRHQPEANPPPAEAGSAATARGAPASYQHGLSPGHRLPSPASPTGSEPLPRPSPPPTSTCAVSIRSWPAWAIRTSAGGRCTSPAAKARAASPP